ncbi:MAG TPA: hypothetical protein PK006_10180 [Saprospiraceae bacterium]|nr:hypothetical protein [Saprospiraceae bacterium]
MVQNLPIILISLFLLSGCCGELQDGFYKNQNGSIIYKFRDSMILYKPAPEKLLIGETNKNVKISSEVFVCESSLTYSIELNFIKSSLTKFEINSLDKCFNKSGYSGDYNFINLHLINWDSLSIKFDHAKYNKSIVRDKLISFNGNTSLNEEIKLILSGKIDGAIVKQSSKPHFYCFIYYKHELVKGIPFNNVPFYLDDFNQFVFANFDYKFQ